ncbi:tetratricopeptide repeat protein [Tatumella saanichensis]|uniref:tetratricopeptide repeat protein n=1 Tax=Tatumella saanichensis TaxID=480813 RepID=UPI0004A45F39|nr:tetratricopeptide repeat protein [Tatumella saanichensis]
MKKTLLLCIALTTLTLTGCSATGQFFRSLWPGSQHQAVPADEQQLQQNIRQCENDKQAEQCMAAGSRYELRGGDDYQRAMDFYQKALSLNAPEAFQAIGHLYENGYGVKQDYTTARQWYQRGADAGEGNAMLYLANMYRYGRGIEKNRHKALQYATQGCKKGNILACSTRKELLKNSRSTKH